MQSTIIIPANGTITLDIPALFFYVKNISITGGQFRLTASAENFEINEVMELGSKISFLPSVVSSWVLTNIQGAQLTITLKTGLVYYEDESVIGSVAVTNKPSVNLNDTTESMMAKGTWTAPASELPFLALHNPVGSGVVLFVEKVSRGSVASGVILSAFLSLVSTGLIAIGIDGYVSQKRKSSTVRGALFRADLSPAEVTTLRADVSSRTIFDELILEVGVPVLFDIENRGIAIQEGEYLYLSNSVVAGTVSYHIEYKAG